ncbi:hypothetical protein CYMTET_35564 [Cymbomonas tetramitiformis]|uniref:ABC-2 type transporter transmembrane domain-containing protein n=1 Tax=Cymbomonas tetramitiformis TaxID=36881 RepID=A0AAE0F8U9_9CHLO|nr:hypothetical protein CYMTET_35564 [Cymbomonas tetramitiformis]
MVPSTSTVVGLYRAAVCPGSQCPAQKRWIPHRKQGKCWHVATAADSKLAGSSQGRQWCGNTLLAPRGAADQTQRAWRGHQVEKRKTAGGTLIACREGPPALLRFKVLARREWKAKLLTYHTAARIGSMALWGVMFGTPYIRISYQLKSTQSFDRIRGIYAISLFNATLTNNGSPVMEYYVLQSNSEMDKGLYKPLESLLAFVIFDTLIVLVPSAIVLTLQMILVGSFYDQLDKIVYMVTIAVLEHCSFNLLLLMITVLIPHNPRGLKLVLFATTPIYTGFMIPVDQMVWPVRLIAYLSPLHHNFSAAMNSMFAGQTIECDDSDDPDCDQVFFSCPV